MHKTLVALMLCASSALAWAVPSLQQVEAEVRLGHLTQAESMMTEVVAAKPDSARAHYIYAEVLARNQKFTEAVAEATTARTLDPAIKFTEPQKFRDFEQLLTRQQAATRMRGVPAPTNTAATTAATTAPPSQFRTPAVTAPAVAAAPVSTGIPGWVWLVALAAIAWFLWRAFSKSRAMSAGNGTPGAVPYGAGNQPVNPNGGPMNPGMPYGAGMPAAAPGGGLLRTGMAVAGGVAGGMLLDQMLNHRANAAGLGPSGNDLGLGPTMAPSGNDAATELETRQVDFGNGNDNDWGSGGGSDSFDTGSSDSGGSWD